MVDTRSPTVARPFDTPHESAGVARRLDTDTVLIGEGVLGSLRGSTTL